MSTALTTLGADQIELIKRTICRDATNDELALFVATANRIGLDPFARQIFSVKRGGVMSIQVSIDGFRLVADRTGNYAPGRPTEYEHDPQGKLMSATAYVKKLAAGVWHEVGETSHLSEYAGGSNPLWKSMPRVMLAKTAEARALRRAFPAELSGVYSVEELAQAEPVTVAGYEITGAPPVIAAAPTADRSIDELQILAALEACATKQSAESLLPQLSKLSDDNRKRARKFYAGLADATGEP